LALLARIDTGKFGSNLWVARVSQFHQIVLAHGLGELLSDNVVAQLFLVLHHPEVVIVAGAKQAVRENLIVSAATGYYPDGSTARSELVFPNFSSFNKTEGLREPFLENSC
jgi:hypothetical protein